MDNEPKPIRSPVLMERVNFAHDRPNEAVYWMPGEPDEEKAAVNAAHAEYAIETLSDRYVFHATQRVIRADRAPEPPRRPVPEFLRRRA